jgi:glycerol-1-phosphate dehydrogenase [NAD(P)+]
VNKRYQQRVYTGLTEPKKNAIHRIGLPRVVLVGETVLDQLGSICKEFGYDSALIVTGDKTYQIAGKKSEMILEDDGLNVCTKRVSEATRETVEAVKGEITDFGADLVLGIGGGRNIDVAKLSSFETDRFFISVPTVASTMV